MFMRAALIGLLVGLSGHAAGQAVTAQERKDARVIRLAEVTVPESPIVFLKRPGSGPILPNIGPEVLPYFNTMGLRIGEIVRQDFLAHASAVPQLPAFSDSGRDGTLQLAISSYGLFPISGVGSGPQTYRAVVKLTARLVMSDGEIWRGSGDAWPDEGEELPFYLESPTYTKEHFRRASEAAVLNLLESFDTTQHLRAYESLELRRAAMKKRMADYEAEQKARLDTMFEAFAAPTARPRDGDSWNYRLIDLNNRSAATMRLYSIKVSRTSPGGIEDELQVDGQPGAQLTHAAGGYLIEQGAAIYSPYLPVLDKPSSRTGTGRARVDGLPACQSEYSCTAVGRFRGLVNVAVPAGVFEAIKIEIEHSWQAATAYNSEMTGSRVIEIWYSPKAKRAVKVASRLQAGQIPPVDSNFVLELVSYLVK